jgi:tRNA threonylcarbamoyladenosine biosynthesis protein TsaE
MESADPDRLQNNLVLPDLTATTLLGNRLGKIAENGDVILLHGDLGTGKTTLTQAIAAGLEVLPEQYVTSPSFALLHEYSGRIALYHMDCYRLSGEDDIEGAGLTEYIGGSGLTVIEWPDRLGSFTPEQRLDITLEIGENNERRCRLTAHGSQWQDRLEPQK